MISFLTKIIGLSICFMIDLNIPSPNRRLSGTGHCDEIEYFCCKQSVYVYKKKIMLLFQIVILIFCTSLLEFRKLFKCKVPLWILLTTNLTRLMNGRL